MLKKSRILWLTVVLLLAFAQAAFAGLTAVGPVLPDADGDPLTAPWSAGFTGYPSWYRDSKGQTLFLDPTDPVSLADPAIEGNAFSAQIQFGSEAMYYTCDSTIDMGGGNVAELIMALEAAFNTGDAAPGEQIVFARIRLRIDCPVEGQYIITHPYGTKTFTVAAADVGRRAINDTSDIGIGAQGVFTGALKGQIGPFLTQVNPPPAAGYIGDLAVLDVPGDPGTPGATVTGSPTGNNFFRVQGPPGSGIDFTTNLFTVGGKLFDGTPFTVPRSTYNRSAAGVFADVFVTVPQPVPAVVTFKARRTDQGVNGGVTMTRLTNLFYARVNFPNGLPVNPTVIVTGTTPGFTPTLQEKPLVDAITVTKAQATLVAGPPVRYTLSIEAFSSDAQAALTAGGWNAGQVAMTAPAAPGAPWTLTVPDLRIPPKTVTVKSTPGLGQGDATVVVLP